MQRVKNRAIVNLEPMEGNKYIVPDLLYGEELKMNVNEGKTNDGFVTVVCATDGGSIRPFWVKGRKNQREIDREVDARFSLHRSAYVVTLNKFGLLVIYRIWINQAFGYVELEAKEVFTVVLNNRNGKLVFTDKIFATKESAAKFDAAIKAAIYKANSPDGGGPTYFTESDPVVIFRQEKPSSMTIVRNKEKTVLAAGIAMPIGHN